MKIKNVYNHHPPSHEGQRINTCFNSLEIQIVFSTTQDCTTTRLNGLHFANFTRCGYTSKPSFGLHCTLAHGGNVFSRKHFAEILPAAFFAMVLTTFLDLLEAHGLRSTFLVGGTCLFLVLPRLPPLPLPAWQNAAAKGQVSH